jgi:hypothetical protein
MVRVIPRAEISEGWVTISQPSRDSMLSKNEETSLAEMVAYRPAKSRCFRAIPPEWTTSDGLPLPT